MIVIKPKLLMSSSDCRLLARAVPLPSKQKVTDDSTIIDSLVNQLESAVIDSKNVSLQKNKILKVSVESSANSNEKQCIERTEECISPADHLALQSLRSSALARKTNTTAKFSRNCRNLFADLMFGEEQKKNQVEEASSATSPLEESKKVEEEKLKEETQTKLVTEEKGVNNSQKLAIDEQVDNTIKKNEENLSDTAKDLTQFNNESVNDKDDNCTNNKKEEPIKQKEPVEGELIARGPIRANFIVHGAPQPFHHPYATMATQHSGNGHSPSGSNTSNMSSPNMGATFNAAAAPQSVLLDQSGLNPAVSFGYGYDCGIPTSNWSGDAWSVGGSDSALSSPSSTPDSIGTTLDPLSPGERSERNELPDNLSDFILEYSRRYSPILSRKASFSESGSPRSLSGDTITNGGESPFSAPKNSPSAPRNGAVGGGSQTPPFAPMPPLTSLTARDEIGIINSNRQAKERLRVLIRSEDMDDAWAWTCKCIQRHPGALTFQDADKDTLLHIVTSHLDLAKIYALVEQMLKMDGGEGGIPNFDIPNAMGETPLMVAVQKNQAEVVSYLLEAGASPNAQSNRLERHMPLHFAASHGMTNIVRALCADSRTKLDAENGMGLSPLLCAFKNHGRKVSEEENVQQNNNLICSLEIINILLNAGANPFKVDATNGRSLAHYAVERMDERLIELLREHLDEKQMAELVNYKDFCGETPMNTIRNVFDGRTELNEEESLKRECIGLALITCGANSYNSNNEI